MTPHLIDAVVDEAVQAQALNAEQDRLITNDTVEIDSISEHAERLLRLTAGEARAHVFEIVRLAANLRKSNDAERECVRRIAPLVEHQGRGIKAAARALRDPLGVLLNPVIRDKADADRRVQWVLENFAPAVLRSAHLSNDLGVRKFSVLQVRLDAFLDRFPAQIAPGGVTRRSIA